MGILEIFSARKSKTARRLAADIELLHNSPLLDPVWYRQTYSDLRDTPVDVARHYLEYGAAEGRNPGPLFDTKFYLERNLEVATSGINPLVHYILRGTKQGHAPRPSAIYESEQQELDARLPFWSSSAHAQAYEVPKHIALFDDLSSDDEPNDNKHGDALRLVVPVFEWRKQIEQSGFFDAEWYLKKNRDVARAGLDPLDHFIQFGSAEYRSPGPKFDARWYLEEYPDVLQTCFDPLAHYLTIGRTKGYLPSISTYKRWCLKFDTLNDEDRCIILRDIASNDFPTLQVIVYFSCDTQDFIADTVKALSNQLFQRWRALLVFEPGYDRQRVKNVYRAVSGDSRYCVISDEYTSDNLAQRPNSGCFVLISGGALLREHALYMVAAAAAEADICLVYSDEDTVDVNGERVKPVFKPKYSPELARQTNYFGPLILIRGLTDAPERIAADLRNSVVTIESLVNRVLQNSDSCSVRHIPSILYHDMLAPRPKTTVLVGSISSEELLPCFTIIIPTRDRRDLLEPCIVSIEERSDYPQKKIEIIVVDNGSTDETTLKYLALLTEEGKARVIQDAGKFNFSRLNNSAADVASHEVLLFLNNDTIVDDPLWLRRISTYVLQKDVAAVGGKLLYPDRTIQHGGVILGVQGVAAHDIVGLEENPAEARLDLTREMSAVTGACLAMRRAVFDKLGRFDTTTAVAFNDTILCLKALKASYRNIYIKEPLLIHFESKSRGYDDEPEKVAQFQREARYVRQRHNALFMDDPYYSPNLCLQQVNELAFPPRRSKPWRSQGCKLERLKILILSSTAEIGHGVAVVISLQAAHLVAAGHEVFIGGPKGEKEFDFAGCHRVHLKSPADAAVFAVEFGMDCVVVETPPFFSVVRWLGEWPRTLFLDHGEPPADLFPDAEGRRRVIAEKRLCFTMASEIFAISASVRAEGSEERAGIIPNGNSHLAVWDELSQPRRNRVRTKCGWEGKAVVLNVCRFGEAEQHYKGVDKYAEIFQEFQFARPRLAAQTTFVLCGKASMKDVTKMTNIGFQVFANVTDSELVDLYTAADIYVNLSRWEGYNLGIGQALALGLPVIASDVPAHRSFPIFTSSDTLSTIERISELIEATINDRFSSKRKPVVTDWKQSLAGLEHAIVELCQNSGALNVAR